MPLTIQRRHGSPNWYLRGTVRRISVDESTGTRDRKAAEEIRAVREAELLKRSVHGDSAVRTFAEAALSYMEAGGERSHLTPILNVIGRKPRVLIFGPDNAVVDRVVYDVFRDAAGRLDMRIIEAETGAEEAPRIAAQIRVA